MIQCVENIIVPYLEQMKDGEDTPALVIMDNFKGQLQVTAKINSLLEENFMYAFYQQTRLTVYNP